MGLDEQGREHPLLLWRALTGAHMADLASLSASERAVLLLLAEGHTAKSAGVALGVTTNAVNERLRDARRKTGVGSSRELARLVRVAHQGGQESRDNGFGLPTQHTADHSMPTFRDRGGPGVRWKGVAGMTTLAAAVGAATAVMVSGALAAHSGSAPHVIATYPAQGASVQPGPLTLSVTFNRPMQAGSYSFVTRDPATLPDCARAPMQSPDGRTFKLSCVLQPHHRYEIGFNDAIYRHFTSAEDGAPGTPARLSFSTP